MIRVNVGAILQRVWREKPLPPRCVGCGLYCIPCAMRVLQESHKLYMVGYDHHSLKGKIP